MGVINNSYKYQHIPTKKQLDFLEFVRKHRDIHPGSYYEHLILQIQKDGYYERGAKMNLNDLRDVYLREYKAYKKSESPSN